MDMDTNTQMNDNSNIEPLPGPQVDHFFKKKEQVVRWLEKMGIQNYTMTKNLIVSVEGDVDIKGKKMDYLPVEFGRVNGNFLCSDCGLLSFKGTPFILYGGFYARNNRVKTLEGGPEDVSGDYHVQNNELESLKGLPEKLSHDLSISNNKLTSFEYMCKHVALDLFCVGNPFPLSAFSKLDFNIHGDIAFTPPEGMNIDGIKEYLDDENDIWMDYNHFRKYHHALLLKEKIDSALPEFSPEHMQLGNNTQSINKLKI